MSSSSTGLATVEAPGRVSQAHRSGEDTRVEMLESVLLLVSGAFVAAPMLPGFTLCIPVLVALAVAVL